MVRRLLFALCLLCVIPLPALAQSRFTLEPAAFQQSPSEWQALRDAAALRVEKGKKKMKYGLIGSAAGLVLAYASAGSCDADGCGGGMMTLGTLVTLGGSGYFAWGYFEYADAKSDVVLLDLQRAGTRLPSASFELNENHRVLASIGSTKSISYGFTF